MIQIKKNNVDYWYRPFRIKNIAEVAIADIQMQLVYFIEEKSLGFVGINNKINVFKKVYDITENIIPQENIIYKDTSTGDLLYYSSINNEFIHMKHYFSGKYYNLNIKINTK